MDTKPSLIFRIFLFLTCLSFTKSQVPLLGQQPNFRGFISNIPISNGEFQPAPGDTERPIVTISDGTLQGITLRTVNGRKVSAFQSIPFAEPPVGPLRFKDPVKAKPWRGILNAMPQSPQCIQLDFVRGLQVHGKEDCLYISVYVPESMANRNHSLPVLFWIHGGGFFFGAGSIYGPRYLLDRDVILVTVNYRLGPFGFLSTGDLVSPGNQGMKDQVLALKWVQENIANFGGDPNSVTIFGESAGAGAVGLHLTSPLSKGLFHRAIQESGSSFCYWANKFNATDVTKRVAELYRCTGQTSEEIIECLQKVPETLLAPVQMSFFEWFTFPLVVFAPVEEPEHTGAFMTKSPEQYYENGEAANVTLINGMNRNELVWLVSGLILDPLHVSDINNQWERVGPIFLEMNYNSTEVNQERARKIWDFYMGNEKLTWETRHQFANLFSDRYLTECSLEQMRYHSMYTNQRVYGYHLTYQGRFSNVQQFGGQPEDWGVSHLDDLIYLMNNPDYYQTLKPGDPELDMSYLMTSIWENFARYDRPYVPDGNEVRDVWEPIQPATDRFSPLKFLELNLNPRMTEDPWVDRYNFWRREINPNP